MKNFVNYFAIAIALTMIAPQIAEASFAFTVVPPNLTVGNLGSAKIRIFGTNNDTMAASTLTILPSTLTLIADQGLSTENMGFTATSNGIAGSIVTTFTSPGAVAAGDSVEIASITFTDTVGGTLENPIVGSFDLGFGFQTDSGDFGGFGTSIQVTAIPEPATLATVGLVVGTCVCRRRRKS